MRIFDLGGGALDAHDLELDGLMIFRPGALPIAHQIALMIDPLVGWRNLASGWRTGDGGHGRLPLRARGDLGKHHAGPETIQQSMETQ